MNLFKLLKESYEYDRDYRQFMNLLTDESRNNYELNVGLQHAALDDIYDAGWKIAIDDNLYLEGTRAYLEKTENGYQIPNIEQKEADLLREQKFLAGHYISIDQLFRTSEAITAFKNGNWELKYGVSETKAEIYGRKIGFKKRKDEELDQNKKTR